MQKEPGPKAGIHSRGLAAEGPVGKGVLAWAPVCKNSLAVRLKMHWPISCVSYMNRFHLI